MRVENEPIVNNAGIPIIIDRGNCNNGKEGRNSDIKWELYSTGLLKLSGHGPMCNYGWQKTPWFTRKSNITSLEIAPTITSIGDRAFFALSQLTGEPPIPPHTTSIGIAAFSCCSGLTGVVHLPHTLQSVGIDAFHGCRGISDFEVDARSIYLSSINGVLYDFRQEKLILVPEGRRGIFTIAPTVKIIKNGACSCCEYLTGSLVIPENVEEIEDRAFQLCRSFSGTLAIDNSNITIGENAFFGCSHIPGIYISGLKGCVSGAPWGAPCGEAKIAWRSSMVGHKSRRPPLISRNCALKV